MYKYFKSFMIFELISCIIFIDICIRRYSSIEKITYFQTIKRIFKIIFRRK